MRSEPELVVLQARCVLAQDAEEGRLTTERERTEQIAVAGTDEVVADVAIGLLHEQAVASEPPAAGLGRLGQRPAIVADAQQRLGGGVPIGEDAALGVARQSQSRYRAASRASSRSRVATAVANRS